MILDYDYNQREKKFVISYINDKGTKSFYEFNISRFKTYYPSPTGKFLNWDNTPCDIKYTDRPNKFDIKEFIEDLPEDIKSKLFAKFTPRLYTWDIETKYDPLEKPDPQSAKFPVTAISVTNPDLATMVLGYKDLTEEQTKRITARIQAELDKIPFFKELGKTMTFTYKKFNDEHDMLAWFYKNIVSKVPVLAGWNTDGFDQQYIINRAKNYYEDISTSSMSCKGRMGRKRVVSPFNPNISTYIPTPKHTLMVDMMDIIGTHDMTVLPIKEALSLDWISKESIGSNKIEYDGDLNTLYDDDFETFVFYNAWDSILVQLVSQFFKTINIIYNYANVCHNIPSECFGKIGPAEALFFMEFHRQGKKVVYYPDRHVERGTLIGAYVKEPTPGRYINPSCFDFSGLYPTNVQCFNLSVENYVGSFYDEEALKPYKLDPMNYIVAGPNVYKNKNKKIDKPTLGEFVGKFLDEKKLKPYREDKNYIVSINGSVYKNDKDYAFKNIQLMLKKNRNETKYLAKNLDAQVMSVIDRIIATHSNGDWTDFGKDVLDWMVNNYNIANKHDIANYPDLADLKHKVQEDIDYMYTREQAFKLLMNSCYGGSSHQSFYWYNMAMANDITGEGRNLIHMMEDKTIEIFHEFRNRVDVHKELGVTIDTDKYDRTIINNPSMVYTIYQDTDSSYINIGPIVDCVKELKGKGDLDRCNFIASFADKYINKRFDEIITEYLTSRHAKNYHVFELETIGKSGIWTGVKKRYAQAILWKDGRTYDHPKMKVKGLEIIKGSYPSFSRNILKNLVEMLLLDDTTGNDYIFKLNKTMMEQKRIFFSQPIDAITEAINVNNYWKNVEDDSNPAGLIMKKGATANQKALALYNWYINTKHLPGENIYGGKIKSYLVKKPSKKSSDIYFAYSAGNYPKWADTYAPIDKEAMFMKTVLEPINRILEPIGFKKLNPDGSISVELGLF